MDIPADRSRWDLFAILASAAKERIIGLVKRMAAAPQTDAAVRQVSDFYCSCMDQSTIEMKD